MCRNLLKSLGRGAISFLPLKLTIIRAGAMLPPFIRNRYTARFLSEVVKHCRKVPPELQSNLGIDRRLRVSISSTKAQLLFGVPSLLVGERSTLDLAVFALQNSDCFLDVGSNIGLFPFYLRFRGNSIKPIYFFEADPALFAQTEENVRRNRIRCVKGFQVAIAEKTGTGIFYRNRTDDSSGTIVKDDWVKHQLEAIKIDQVSLDDFVLGHKLNNICAKVDIEGAEEQFYEGAKQCLNKLKFLIIEILGPAIKRGFPQKLILEGGFHAYYIKDYELQHSPSGEYSYIDPYYNWLFCRDNPAVLRRKLQNTGFRVVE